MPRGRPKISQTVLSDEPLSPEEAALLVDEPTDPTNGSGGEAGDQPHETTLDADSAPSDSAPAPKPRIAPDGANQKPSAGLMTYKARIQVLEAWQYPGILADAPAWIDRNWASWFDGGQLSQGSPIPGPALRIPSTSSPTGEKMCLSGDYVVRQEVTIIDNVTETSIEVWPKDDFERLFIPSRARAPKAA